jgi:diguanylate cyclase (GGDEF)-like protein
LKRFIQLVESRLVSRLAVAGMALAFLAVGSLAVWAAVVTQNGAQDLSRAGVQTSGHVRALQALSTIDTQTDGLEEEVDPVELRKLREAQAILAEALVRMERGGVVEQRRIARDVERTLTRLNPAIEHFLAAPRDNEDAMVAAEEEMEVIMEVAQVRLNDLRSDPSNLLAAELESVTASERAVRRTATVLVPLGLLFVGMCAWLLSLYRRRTEATMREALELHAREARTDQLTGLANRRALLEQLERSLHGGFVAALADLNGFKHYNDTFGHAAGDALLRRLGRRLEEAGPDGGLAARLGGDEFCVLFPPGTRPDEADDLVRDALSEAGEGFSITSSCGVVSVPQDAIDIHGALRIADARMYATKPESRPAVGHTMSQVLLRMLEERHPGLGHHVEDVANIASACAEALALSAEDARDVERAAELHDIGKLAIPEAILTKPGPLSADEWDFMRRHSVIGERVLMVVPSMERVALLVRASHERWDGTGYPDELAGEQIPVGARILAVADAFCAMTEDRPYGLARTTEEALAELQACSGTQFDPATVEAFLTVFRTGRATRRRVAAAAA